MTECINGGGFDSTRSLTALNDFSRKIGIGLLGLKYCTGWGDLESHDHPSLSCCYC